MTVSSTILLHSSLAFPKASLLPSRDQLFLRLGNILSALNDSVGLIAISTVSYSWFITSTHRFKSRLQCVENFFWVGPHSIRVLNKIYTNLSFLIATQKGSTKN